MARYATNSWQARQALAERRPYNTYGAMRAEEGSNGYAGWLREPYRASYLNAWRDNKITYTVYSYSTPIAWVLDTGEVIEPPIKYSVTTSKHQGLLYALDASSDTRAAIHDAAYREAQYARERAAERRSGRSLEERTGLASDTAVNALRTADPRPSAVDLIDEVLADYASANLAYSEDYAKRARKH